MNFWGGATLRKANYYAVNFDRENNAWQVDAGAINGIIEGDFHGERTVFNVFAEDASEEELNDPSMALGQISVRKVFPYYSTVRMEGNLWLDQNTAYRARLHDMPIEPMKVFIRGTEDHAVNAARIAVGDDPEAGFYIELVEKSEDATYIIHAANDEYTINRATDAEDQPLVEQVKGFTPEGAEKIIDQIVHVAKWERIMELRNPGSMLFSEAIRAELYHPTEDRVIRPEGDGYLFTYRHADGPSGRPRFRVKLVNTSGQRLYVALLYMSSSFEINPGTLPNGGVWLDANAEVWAINGKPIEGVVSEAIHSFGKKEVTETFKIIMSTAEFNPVMMRMKSLGAPRQRERSMAKQQTSRSLMFGDMTATPTGDDWNTNELSITIRRED